MKNKIILEIRGDDKTGAALKQVMNSVDKTAVTVDSKSRRIARSFSGINAAIGGLVGIYGIQRIVSSSINAASALEEMSNKFDTVFKGVNQRAEAFAESLTESFGMSTREGKQYLASVQDILVPMGIARAEAAELSNEVVKLSADLGSFNNLPTADVMRDIQAALVGEYESMRKYGVVLMATTVQQKALEMGLAKTKNELTAGDKALAAYKMMVEGSKDAIGDFARTSDSYANQVKILRANIEDFSATLGQILLPTATKIVGVFNEAAKGLEILLGKTEKARLIRLRMEILDELEKLEKELLLPGGITLEEGMIGKRILGDEKALKEGLERRISTLKTRLMQISKELKEVGTPIMPGVPMPGEGIIPPTMTEKARKYFRKQEMEEAKEWMQADAEAYEYWEKNKVEIMYEAQEEILESRKYFFDEQVRLHNEFIQADAAAYEWWGKNQVEIEQATQDEILATKNRAVSKFVAAGNKLLIATNSQSKTMFRLFQTISAAHAIISAHRAAAKALAEVPWPYNWIEAAAEYAAAMAEVAAIKSVSAGGGLAGGGAVPVYQAAPTTGLPQMATTEQQQAGPQIEVHVHGPVLGETKEALADYITEIVREGVEVRGNYLPATKVTYD